MNSVFSRQELEAKIIAVQRDIESIIAQMCDEKFWVHWYGAFDIDPKHLVYWICVESDRMKKKLQQDAALAERLRGLLITHDYPVKARKFAYIGFESQETVDRESKGNWYHHWK